MGNNTKTDKPQDRTKNDKLQEDKKPKGGIVSGTIQFILFLVFITLCLFSITIGIQYYLHQFKKYDYLFAQQNATLFQKVFRFNVPILEKEYYWNISLVASKIPHLCVFISFLLTFLSKVPVTFGTMVTVGKYNNMAPRYQQNSFDPRSWVFRATSAHNNSFEAFPAFAVGVILALSGGVPLLIVAKLSVLYILSRFAFHIFYIAGIAPLRSIVWLLGFLCVAHLFVYSTISTP